MAHGNVPQVDGLPYAKLLRWAKLGYIPVEGSAEPGNGYPVRYGDHAQATAHIMFILVEAGMAPAVAAIAARQIRNRPDEWATIAPGVTVRVDLENVQHVADEEPAPTTRTRSRHV